MVRLAVAADRGMVSSHFGRCQEYEVFNIGDDDEIMSRQTVPNPGHEPGFLPQYLGDIGVTCLIAGGMGVRARDLFSQKEIEIVVGVSGPVEDVVRDFISGKIEPGVYTDLCEEHDHDHDHECRR